jgi:uncharacterized protein (TIGR00159 family)
MKLIDVFRGLGIAGFLDIAFMTLLIFGVLVWFKRTKAAFVLTGILIIAAVYVIAREFNLYLTAAVLQGFFAVILIAVIVIFHEELRQFFEQVAVWSLERRLSKSKSTRLSSSEVETLVRTTEELAREKTGALIVIRGKDMIIRYLNGGIDLDGKLSEPLLKSIFDPHSIGHDGAVVIERGKISKFACHLPLSKDVKSLGYTGTRHAAALGLSEVTDAFCIVVSEERGSISVFLNGTLTRIKSSEELSGMLARFYQQINPTPFKKPWQNFFKENSREKVIAFGVAVGLWFTLVYGSRSIHKTYSVPIQPTVLSSGWKVSELRPKAAEVAISGPRRAFYFFDSEDLSIHLKIWNPEEGFREITLSDSDVLLPEKFTFEHIEPPLVTVCLERNEPGVDVH